MRMNESDMFLIYQNKNDIRWYKAIGIEDGIISVYGSNNNEYTELQINQKSIVLLLAIYLRLGNISG
jgi:hypothetical protein